MAFKYIVSRILDTYPGLHAEHVEMRLEYGSFASLKDRFLYIEVPKAASSSIKTLLRGLITPVRVGIRAIHARDNVPLPPITALDDKDQQELLEASDVLRFTVVRNPYSRLVSAWRTKVFLRDPDTVDVYSELRAQAPALGQKNLVNFDEFVSYIESAAGRIWDAHWQRQVDLTFPKSLSFNHIGKVETLEATVQMFTKHLNYSNKLTVPRANEASIRPAPKFSAQLATRVYTLYEEDFTTFRYEVDSWPHDETDSSSLVSQELIDQIMHCNFTIAQLSRERDRLRHEYNVAYRFSLARIQNKLRRIMRRHMS
jgi:Sulfotransferase family